MSAEERRPGRERAARVREPDWKRLGARFGEPDVCVEFAAPGYVFRAVPGRAPKLLAEDVIALREARDGVRVQVACGLILVLPGARLVEVDRVVHAAHVTV